MALFKTLKRFVAPKKKAKTNSPKKKKVKVNAKKQTKKIKKPSLKKTLKKTVKRVKKIPAKPISKKKNSKTLKKTSKKAAEKMIGKIIHYYGKIDVGIIKLKAPLKVGDKIHIKGAHDDFSQDVSSMQYNHKDISTCAKGKEVGIKVTQRVHENDKVFILKK